jgi:hypothetical protein
MEDVLEAFRVVWLAMLTPPWQKADPEDNSKDVLAWVIGWVWAIAGVILGAVIAPYILEPSGFTSSPYQDAIVVGTATVGGFLVRFIDWRLVVSPLPL